MLHGLIVNPKHVQVFDEAAKRHPCETLLLLSSARVHDAINNTEAGMALYKQVLQMEASSVEAVSCLAAHRRPPSTSYIFKVPER